jgi:predicted RNA-binding Zn ribbon-like protein
LNSDLVIDFVNTVSLDSDREELSSAARLRDWLSERGLEPGSRATTADLDDALELREALRDLLSAHTGLETDVARATAVIDGAAARAPRARRIAARPTRLQPAAAGVRGALGRIVAEVALGMADGTWERMKACRADDCRWAFLDTAKNRTRAWCSMQSCGNRAKVQAYRERHA